MALNIQLPENKVLKPQITVFGIGGAGGNATNNMIKANLEGVNFVIANTDAQALDGSVAEKKIQLGQSKTQGLGAGASPEVGAEAAEEAMDEINDHLKGSNMVFITAGMGGGTGTGAAPVIARAARDLGILTVGVVTKPFHFEGPRRMRIAEDGLEELQKYVDTLIVIPNQNLFRIANEKTTFADAFKLADDVLHSGVRGVTDLMIMPGLINLDFADVKAVMSEMGKAMMGTGEAEGERRAQEAAEAAISNPLLDNVSMKGAQGVLINITGGSDMTLFEVDEAANRIREEVDSTANIIFGSTFNDEMDGKMRVSVVATGIDMQSGGYAPSPSPKRESVYAAAAVVSAHANDEAEEDAVDSEEAQEAEDDVMNAPSFANNLFSDSVEEDEDEEGEDDDVNYRSAIESLNAEYNASLNDNDEEEVGSGLFVSPEPVRPSNYNQSDVSSFEHGLFATQANEAVEEKIVEKSEKSESQGGLFSRMAKAFQTAEESYVEEKGKASKDSDDDDDDDMMDVPAFLRRKA